MEAITIKNLTFGLILVSVVFCSCKDSSNQSVTQANTAAVNSLLAAQKNEVLQKQAYAKSITECLVENQKTFSFNTEARTEAMRNIDLSKCPTDFASVYMKYIHAWEDAALIQRAQKDLISDQNIESTALQSLLANIFKTNDSPISDAVQASYALNQKANEAEQNIHKTYEEVEDIAVYYGATLPKPVAVNNNDSSKVNVQPSSLVPRQPAPVVPN